MSLRTGRPSHRLAVHRLRPARDSMVGGSDGIVPWGEDGELDADDRVPVGALVYADTGVPAAADAGFTRACTGTPAVGVAPAADLWCGQGPRTRGRWGAIDWTEDEHLLFGALELDPAGADGDFTRLAAQAYAAVFGCLAARGKPQLLRLWNYLPGIHADDDGLERYRRFNAGRQQAFVEAGRSAFEGAPAACALGVADGPLRVRFLAARQRPLAIENPRQVPAWRYPAEHGPRSPSFSRAALVDAGAGEVGLLVSGTASIVGHHSLHPEDLDAQVDETVRNLEAVLAAAQARCGARFDLAQADCTLYVRHRDDLARVRERFGAALGAASPAVRDAVLVQADICRRELLVEIEAHVFAPGQLPS